MKNCILSIQRITAVIITMSCIFATVSINAGDWVVTSNVNAGAGSLRETINNSAEGDNITFSLAAGNETISIESELEIWQGLTIDGSNTDGSGEKVTIQVTQPGVSNWRVFSSI